MARVDLKIVIGQVDPHRFVGFTGAPLSDRLDIVVASCGVYPKDITLYQAQKGQNMASQALKPEGKILLLAACEQGVGDQRYYDYACSFQSIQDAMQDFKSRWVYTNKASCALKLISNMIGTTNVAVLAEGIKVGDKAGIERNQLLELLADTGPIVFRWMYADQ